AQTIYVDADATGANDGTSWTNAYTDLQDALAIAVYGDSIWVAQGTYYPSNTVDRNEYFEIKEGVHLFGGFAGTETDFSQRDIIANLCILSGDIDMDGSDNLNSYTILYVQLDSSYALVDGFTIENGQADGSGTLQKNGGAVYIDGGAGDGGLPFFLNNIFKSNYATNFGGAIYANGINGGHANYWLESCQFIDNQTIFNGGAIQNDGESSPVIADCVFTGNQSSYGGAIYNNGNNEESSPIIVSCTFNGNHANQTGGAVYNFGKSSNGISSPLLFNCLIYDNTSSISAAALYSLSDGGTSEMEVLNSTFYNNYAANGGHVYVNESNGGTTETTLRNCILWGSASDNAPFFAFSSSSGQDPEVNIDYSLVDAVDCDAMYQDNNGILTCGVHMIYDIDPLFEDEINRDFRIQQSSPAINHGDSTLVHPDCLDFDRDGNFTETFPYDVRMDAAYPRIDGDSIDMGAYEKAGGISMPIEFLPIELLSFKAQAQGAKVVLEWVTLSESNNDYFSVERSVDGFHFEEIAVVAGAGTSIHARHYTAFDENPFAGNNYYRLKQKDFDGRTSYSDVQVVTILGESQIYTYPNPVAKTLFVALSDFKAHQAGFEIYHLSGKGVYASTADVNEGVVEIDLEQPMEELMPGTYFIRIENKKGADLYAKFVKVGL
ncbi:MAG TPA: T9SS type A sorting domain-containing protein, partial [Phaeodactylibacter sp.]|nr:T9SS type A sorting domain-containing protein [Phaeodactylibacter sp.]